MPLLAEAEPSVQSRRRQGEPQPLRILVVEDNMVLRRAMLRALTEAGFEVRATRDGMDATESAFRHSYDLIVAEDRLPGMNGLALARSLGVLPHPPRIVLLTSDPAPSVRSEAAKAGVETVLPKPLRLDSLEMIVGRTREDVLNPVRRTQGRAA